MGGGPAGSARAVADALRGRVIGMSHAAKAPHLGSCLSCLDLLTVLYASFLQVDPRRPDDPDRDRFILSKGHAAPALYAVLAHRGFFPAGLLDGYTRPDSPLEEHPGPRCVPGVEVATGSLGHGLPIGVGMALAANLAGRRHRTVVLLSDGECNEGSVWEAAMYAAARRLDRLIAIIDVNKWQATGRSAEVMALEPLPQKWEAFGWTAMRIDGHDHAAIAAALARADAAAGTGRPFAIVADTVKGKGVSFMEDDNNWHYRIPTAEEVARARQELGLP
ncbi:MAG: transketolase [Candidatus Riflebacteria bacterium]|nr:transketolase [Candidatus Riflebacteria bacterium]